LDTSKELNENDVICGRGGATNSHIGNQRFRHLVQEYRSRYLQATKTEKTCISRTIVNHIRSQNPPGRFLIINKSSENRFEDIGDLQARKKTSQALREKPKSKKLFSQERIGETLEQTDEQIWKSTQKMIDSKKSPFQSHFNQNSEFAENVDQTCTLAQTRITEPIHPTNTDVLFGRGAFAYSKGNKNFRVLIKSWRDEYQRAPKMEKSDITQLIVDIVHKQEQPGRFLKLDTVKKLWIEVSDDVAREKVRQALREKIRDKESKRAKNDSNILPPKKKKPSADT